MITRARAAVTAAIVLVAGLVCATRADADLRRWTPVASKSEVVFEASFPLGGFTGRTQDITGEFRADPDDMRRGVTGVLKIRAAGLRTGNNGRDRDMYRALAVEQHPEIRFVVERVEVSFPSATDRADVLMTISGLMSIHGVERQMSFPGRMRVRDEKLWVRGEGRLRMSDFGIRPPARFFLDVKDLVLVSFDVTLAAE